MYLGFSAGLAAVEPADEYILDFADVSFASPGWMVSTWTVNSRSSGT